jgi:NADPH:quinone reductase-like Zn-dependent oxidoreductase
VFALQYSRFGGPEVLSVGSAETPHAGPGEVRMAVRASEVSPADALLRAGALSPEVS